MSLITCCPTCGTLFRVVPDQLKISDGWVRCGQCQQVFDATTALRDDAVLAPEAAADFQPTITFEDAEEPQEPHPLQEPQAAPAPTIDRAAAQEPDAVVAFERFEAFEIFEPAPAPAPPAPDGPWIDIERAADAPVAIRPDLDLNAFADTDPAQDREPEPEPEPVVEAPDRVEPTLDGPLADAPPDLTEPLDDPALAETDTDTDTETDTTTAPKADAALPPPAAPDAPRWPADSLAAGASAAAATTRLEDVSFVRQARRRAFWRRPSMRAVLALVVSSLALLLAGQSALVNRDRLAVQLPGLRPVLVALCAAMDCTLGPPREIEAITIDSSSFNRLRADAYRLAVTLNNQSPLAVAMPALELTLTDTQDQPVLRRVLMPAELGPDAPAVLTPGAEWATTLTLAVAPSNSTARIAGYRLLAFYP